MALRHMRSWCCVLAWTGLVWLTWMGLWGHNFDSLWGGLSFLFFFTSELTTYLLSFFFFFNFWLRKVQPAVKPLSALRPAFDQRPIVNCVVCHYHEDLNITRETLSAALKMDQRYLGELRLHVLDDSFFQPDSISSIQRTPQGPEEDIEFVCKKEANLSNLSSPPTPDLPTVSNDGSEMVKLIVSVLQEEAQRRLKGRACEVSADVTATYNVVRPDCAEASLKYTFFYRPLARNDGSASPGNWLPFHVFLVARVKPFKGHHHCKAGNLNNAIYNERMSGQFMLVLDNDMKPYPEMLNYLLPQMYRRRQSSFGPAYEEDRAMAWVQSPQYTHGKDGRPESELFTVNYQNAKASFGLCQCNGTNMIFRLDALRHIEGVPYDSVSEDALAGLMLHRKGYRSGYVKKELAVGHAPPNAAAAVLQQLRWCKGGFQILLWELGIQKPQPIQFRSEEERKAFLPSDREELAANREKQRWVKKLCFYHVPFQPVLASIAVFYYLTALIFLWTGEAPVHRPSFVPMLIMAVNLFARFMALKCACEATCNQVLSALRGHFECCFAACLGVTDAVSHALRGKGIPWVSTGCVKKHWTAWVNYTAVLVALFGVCFRLVIALERSDWYTMICCDLTAILVILVATYPLWEAFKEGVATYWVDVKQTYFKNNSVLGDIVTKGL